uniref:Uncharacterized protein n=1 Tax=Onchocerca volvulus TaxID=6282 RepID=A0A8R1XUF2_ONCVO
MMQLVKKASYQNEAIVDSSIILGVIKAISRSTVANDYKAVLSEQPLISSEMRANPPGPQKGVALGVTTTVSLRPERRIRAEPD